MWHCAQKRPVSTISYSDVVSAWQQYRVINPFRTAVSFWGPLGTNYLKIEWFVPKMSPKWHWNSKYHYDGGPYLIENRTYGTQKELPGIRFDIFTVNIRFYLLWSPIILGVYC